MKIKLLLSSVICAIVCAVSATQYSCLSIITESKAIGKWDALKSWISSVGVLDEWNKCSYVTDTFPQYATVTNAIVTGGVMTHDELVGILQRSVDTSMNDSVLMSLYRREMSTEGGRTKWHGKRVKAEEDMTNLVQTYTYEDGYKYSRPFSKSVPLTVDARFNLEKTRKAAEEKRRLRQLPPGLRKIHTKRQANASTTNEVNVIVTSGSR